MRELSMSLMKHPNILRLLDVLRIITAVSVVVLVLTCHLSEGARNRGRGHANKGCEFPERFKGLWFQKGVHPPIRIEKDVFSSKGKCLESEGGALFFIESSLDKCFRCMVIYEKHPNVLQYRETFCYEYKNLREACSILTADATLYSLFRVDAVPVPCQLKGPFTFSYNRGHGSCVYPVSTIDSCIDDTRLLFRFQACADVMGSESSVEELSCLAVWKEGSSHYLVGRMSNQNIHNLPITDDNSYRCFAFEFLQERGEIHMSQSGDATCDGLVNAWEGSRTMRLVKSEYPISRCHLPSWAIAHHRWHTLDGSKMFVFSHKNTTFRILNSQNGNEETKFTCIEEVASTSNSTTLITYGTSGCESGYVCMKFFKRNDHIIEVLMADFTRSTYEACSSTHADKYFQEFVTLVAYGIPTSNCPLLAGTNGFSIQVGKTTFPIENCRDNVDLIVGCRTQDRIEFLERCASLPAVKSFHCHGHWEENGRRYLVTGLRNTKSKYCFVYWSNDKTTHLSGIHDTCRRIVELGVSGNFSFNISSAGHCDSLLSSRAARRMKNSWTPFTTFALLLITGSLFDITAFLVR